jgi:hypothetical protein
MRPYNQGNIDRFCAVYAVINACRRAVHKHHKFGFEEGCAFYENMMQFLIDSGLIEDVLYNGSSYEVMTKLLDQAKAYLKEKYGFRLHYKRPFVDTKLSVGKVLKLIRHFLKRNDNSSCIIRFFNMGVWDHWSVIRRGHGLRLKLFDSYHYPELHINECLWGPYKKDGHNYLAKEGIILIKVFAGK